MGTAPAEIETPYAVIAGAGLPLGPLSELARWVEAATHAGAESPAAAAAVERALAALRAAWPGLEPAERGLLGELVTDLVARRPAPGEPGATPSGEPLEAALALLGVRRLRPGQDRAIAAGLAGRDALVVMATGSGKSLCYQAPATVLSGLTVVVSPLIALMADQLAGLERAGVAAATLNSDMPEERQRAALEGARSGAISLLYVAPERFHSASFRAALAASPIALLVVDEAHCVSEWGHEFRPDYRRVGQFRGEIGSPPTMALTATATPRVQADIARRLGLRRPVTVVGGFDRPNITFDALWVEGKGSVARKRGAMLAALEAAGGGKAIVYCGTRRASDETAELLRSSGYAAVAYHAGRTDRTEAQEAFTSGSAQVVAATNAFGMGVNVPDVRLVVHTALPDSLEQLYQEAGRAGRDGDPARHVIVAGPADEAAIRRRIARARIEPADVERLVGRLAARADGEGRFHLDRAEVDDETGVQLAIAERAGALEQRGAPGGGREGRLAAPRLTSEQRRDLDAEVRTELRRRYDGLDRAVAYVRADACRRQAFLDHFGDPSDPLPEERCCDHCSPAVDLVAGPAAAPAAASAPPATEGLSVDERRVYDALRAWRSEVAGELGWPAFRVASNRTLAGVARSRPRSERELSAVRGVGPWLMETHGPRLLEIVAARGGET